MLKTQNATNNNETNCINALIKSSNLVELSSNLSSLLKLIQRNEAKSKMINQLSSSISENNCINMLESRCCNPRATHFIFDEGKSAPMYLNLRWQKSSNIKNNIFALESVIDIINNEITLPQGSIISNDEIENIMEYVNMEYAFSERVLKHKPIIILRFPHSDKRWNACCTTVLTKNDKIETVISLYHKHTDSNASPEYIFFHELGHILQIAVTGSHKEVPASFLQIASSIFPGLDTEYLEQAPEFFADCFAIGAMLNSPFSTLCPFANIHYADKSIFQLYMKALICSLK